MTDEPHAKPNPMPYPAGETPGDQPADASASTPSTNGVASRTRDGNGKFDRSIDTAQRDAQAARLRAMSLTYRQIAAQLNMSVSGAHDAVHRALRDTLEEPAEDVRRLEMEKLDALERAAHRVLAGHHIVVSNGRVATLNDEPLPDSGPVLQAIATLLRISESRRKLLGLDQPTKVTVDGGVRYEVVGVDPEKLT